MGVVRLTQLHHVSNARSHYTVLLTVYNVNCGGAVLDLHFAKHGELAESMTEIATRAAVTMR